MRLHSNVITPHAPPSKPTPRFAGKEEYEVYKSHLDEFPKDTIKLLARIQQDRTSDDKNPTSGHYIKQFAQMTSRIGAIDQHIGWLSKQFVSLLHAKESTQFEPSLKAYAQEQLEDLDKAVLHALLNDSYDSRGIQHDTPYKFYQAHIGTFSPLTIAKLLTIKRDEISNGIKFPNRSPLAKRLEDKDKDIEWLNKRLQDLATIMDPQKYTEESNKYGQAHLTVLEKVLSEKFKEYGFDDQDKKVP